MESTSIATSSSMRALKFIHTPQQTPTKPKLITFLHNPNKKPNHLRCSTKPHTNTNADQHSTSEPQTPKPISTNEFGFVFGLGAENSWDSSDIGSPVVKRFLSDDEERWYMWYHGRSSSDTRRDSIGLAVSSNGVHWERGTGSVQSASDVGLVMTRGDDWWAFDTHGVRPAEIVTMSSSKVRLSAAVYWMYYTGLSQAGSEESETLALKSLPGLAISQDGRHWARIEGDHHTGALFDDPLSVESPKVVFHATGDLRMYYHTAGELSVAVARSGDGIRWVKLGKAGFGVGGQRGNFDERGALNPHVVKRREGGYLMAYEGVGPDGERRIGCAESGDGLGDWARVGVLEAQDGWDYGSPCLVQMEDQWRVYYRAVEIGTQGRVGIGMATSSGTDVTKFTTWSGFHI